MLDVIICANFGLEKLLGLGNTRGQILEFPIEMAGHPYNSAASAACDINNYLLQVSDKMYRIATIHALQTTDSREMAYGHTHKHNC